MPSILKPVARHPSLEKNAIGLTMRDYEGSMSTLCAGCGHDSITAAIIRAFWELGTPPNRIAKLSGIGCSAKTTAYFVSGAHGFNSAHGRMAPIATGANAANRDLIYIGISGDGDSLSIGLGHMGHAIRRNLNMVYIIENNGVYGLTKGQFSASADIGSKPKKGDPNIFSPIDPVMLGLGIGATFLARGFSGDKAQLVPILKAAVAHKGLALLDIISPCVSFNDHEGSTKSYLYTRQHDVHIADADFIQTATPIEAVIPKDMAISVPMFDGSVVKFRSVPEGYDPTNRLSVLTHMEKAQQAHEVPTGLLYLNETAPDLHEISQTVDTPLVQIPFQKLCPGSAKLAELQAAFR